MRRRRFLQGLGAVAGALGLSRASKPAAAAEDSPHVIVVGAGPAGLSAAIELAERGVRVTLIEAAETVGGKVVGWEESVEGERVDAEHGIHGWWPQYLHFRDLMARHASLGVLRPWGPNDNGLFTPDTVVRRFKDQAAAYVNAAHARGYANFPRHFRQGGRWVRQLPDHPEWLAALAGRTLEDWASTKPPLTITTTFDRMVAWSMYFRGPGEVDAAVAMEGEWFYWSGTGKADQVEWLTGNPQTQVFNPLADAFVALGGELRLGTPVAGLQVEDGRVVGVRLGGGSVVATIEGAITGWQRHGMALVGPGATADAPPLALSAACTHMGCPVNVAPTGFACPCHGGQYNRAGQPTSGPPERPLSPLEVRATATGFEVVDPRTPSVLRADTVILAVDVPALKRLAAQVLPKVTGLRATREAVARFWFDSDVDPTLRPASLVDGYAHASNLFLVHRLQERARVWAAANQGSVIEVQAYRDLPDSSGPELLDTLEAELRSLLPSLSAATRLHATLTDGDTFTWFAPDWHDYALEVDPGVPGLLLAGDHLRTERMCQFMEKAVYTGRLAANTVLSSSGRESAPILPYS